MALSIKQLVSISIVLNICVAWKPITLYSDFGSSIDQEFFIKVYPWIVNNMGHEIRVSYNFIGSGLDSSRLMCALRNIKNILYESQFLMCAANLYFLRREYDVFYHCIPDGIDVPLKPYSTCVQKQGPSLVRQSMKTLDRIQNSKNTPLIDLGHRQYTSYKTFDNAAMILETICKLFGRNRPIRCDNPSVLPTGYSSSE
ncbi:uncharacterized protein LOC125490616 [Plutella xylostella]|uniref:uncharacterized protein LOC125490616 n=1 Tax=Plutella xylostella TaxID=51655 RepID=UPI002032766A|nr:uncharacterized protein LOC125490616 [Plutella xylostella]